jgi:hypothetical protein
MVWILPMTTPNLVEESPVKAPEVTCRSSSPGSTLGARFHMHVGRIVEDEGKRTRVNRAASMEVSDRSRSCRRLAC